MNGKDLMEGLSYLSEEYVQQAQDAPKRKRKSLRMWSTLAACLCVLLLGVWGFLPRAEKSEEAAPESMQQADGCRPEIGETADAAVPQTENDARPEAVSPDGNSAGQIRLVVDHWEENRLYVTAEETKDVFLLACEGESYSEATLQPGTTLTAIVTDWDEEQGILYVQNLKPLK